MGFLFGFSDPNIKIVLCGCAVVIKYTEHVYFYILLGVSWPQSVTLRRNLCVETYTCSKDSVMCGVMLALAVILALVIGP